MPEAPAKLSTIPEMTPAVGQVYDASNSYLDGTAYQPDEDEPDCMVRERHTLLDDGSLVYIKHFADNPETLFEGTVAFGNTDAENQASYRIDNAGELIWSAVGENVVADNDVRTEVTINMINRATQLEQERAAIIAKARTAEMPKFGELESISEETAAAIFERATADPAIKEMLQGKALLPLARQRLTESMAAYYSPIFKSGQHLGVMTYVEHGGEVTPRYYYLSNSQAVWRYLPGQFLRNDGKVIHGKGDSELSLMLPVPMQRSLATLSQTNLLLERAADIIDKMHPVGPKPLEVQFQDRLEMLSHPVSMKNIETMQVFPDKPGPRDVTIAPENAEFGPDYGARLDSWEQPRADGSTVVVNIVGSKDGLVDYMYTFNKLKLSLQKPE
jgi:hypothetical protein